MDNHEQNQEERTAIIAPNDDKDIPQQEVYAHFKYIEKDCMFHYEDDGFPTGQYMTHYDGPGTLKRMLQILDELRLDRKIRLIIDYDPDFPIAMARFWGTYLPEIKAKMDAARAESALRHGWLKP